MFEVEGSAASGGPSAVLGFSLVVFQVAKPWRWHILSMDFFQE